VSAESIQSILSQQYTPIPGLAGVGYDFFEYFDNGQRIMQHSGSGSGFISYLVLIPEHNIGYFISTNSADGSLAEGFLSAFLDFSFPEKEKIEDDSTHAALSARAGRYSGWYWFPIRDRKRIEKVESLIDGYVHVKENPDNTLTIDSDQYFEIEPGLFQRIYHDPVELVGFYPSDDRNITHLYLYGNSYTRVPWYSSFPSLAALGLFCILMLVSASIRWGLIAAIKNRTNESGVDIFSQISRKGIACISAAFLVTFIICVIVLMQTTLPSVSNEFQVDVPLLFRLVLSSFIILSVLTIPLLYLTSATWVKKVWPITERVHYSTVVIALLTFIWFLNYWNLLGFRF
jgi:hypothetical protein